jgi:hypothetical protein
VDLPNSVTFIAFESLNLVVGKGCGHCDSIILANKEITHLAPISVDHVYNVFVSIEKVS